jgi:DNA polymerase zeta
VFYSFQGSYGSIANNTQFLVGKFLVGSERLHRIRDVHAQAVSSELELLNRVVDTVVELDPDIIVGWDVQIASWGYLNARGQRYGLFICWSASRQVD